MSQLFALIRDNIISCQNSIWCLMGPVSHAADASIFPIPPICSSSTYSFSYASHSSSLFPSVRPISASATDCDISVFSEQDIRDSRGHRLVPRCSSNSSEETAQRTDRLVLCRRRRRRSVFRQRHLLCC